MSKLTSLNNIGSFKSYVVALTKARSLAKLPQLRKGEEVGAYGEYVNKTNNITGDTLQKLGEDTLMIDGTIKTGGVDEIEATVSPEGKGLSQSEDLTRLACLKYLHIQKSATLRGLDFNLSFSEVKALVKVVKCHYTGLKMNNMSGPLVTQRTFDRINPDLGYVKGNVVACTHAANQFKAKIEHEFSGANLDRGEYLRMILKMFNY